MGALIREVVEEEDDYHDNHGDNDMMAIVHHDQILWLCKFGDKYIWYIMFEDGFDSTQETWLVALVHSGRDPQK